MGPQYAMYFGNDENAIKQTIANKVGTDFYLKKLAEKAGLKIEDKDREEINKQFENKEFMSMLKEQQIDPNLLKELYYNDMLIVKLIDKKKAEVTDEQLAKLVEEKYKDQDMNKYVTRHILFRTTNENDEPLPANEKEAVRVKANAVLGRALKGEDFAALAKEFSEDGSKENGGLIEMYNDGSIVKEYSDAVLGLKKGEVCPTLVESQFGFHIIKLDDKIENGRREQLKEEVVEKWYSEVAEEAKITVKPEVVGEVK